MIESARLSERLKTSLSRACVAAVAVVALAGCSDSADKPVARVESPEQVNPIGPKSPEISTTTTLADLALENCESVERPLQIGQGLRFTPDLPAPDGSERLSYLVKNVGRNENGYNAVTIAHPSPEGFTTHYIYEYAPIKAIDEGNQAAGRFTIRNWNGFAPGAVDVLMEACDIRQ